MTLWPLGIFALAAVGVAAGMIVLAYALGERHREPATLEPYESGIAVTGSARARVSISFYLIAVFFVIFDLEVALIVAWALVARQVGWTGYAEIAVFIGVLLVALLYLWRDGALEWGTTARLRQLEGASR